jgi:flagellar biosynthesis protein FliR
MPSEFYGWFMVFARAGAILMLFPFFSSQNFPIQLRVALAGLIAFLVAPVLPPVRLEQGSIWSLSRLLLGEVSVGLLLGFVCRMVFYALDLAGSLIATETGLMLSASFNPLASATATAPGLMLYWLALMLLLSLDLHHWIILGLQRSYLAVPVGQAQVGGPLLEDIVAKTGGVFLIGVEVAAPVVAVSVVITLIFSVLSRAVPQMNVFAESFPVRTLAGLIMFGVTVPLAAQHILNYLRRLPEDLARVSQLMGLSS